MTKDEINARIESCQAELESLDSGTGESGESELDAGSRREHLEREIAGLRALIEEG